jgi:hypothetical protein
MKKTVFLLTIFAFIVTTTLSAKNLNCKLQSTGDCAEAMANNKEFKNFESKAYDLELLLKKSKFAKGYFQKTNTVEETKQMLNEMGLVNEGEFKSKIISVIKSGIACKISLSKFSNEQITTNFEGATIIVSKLKANKYPISACWTNFVIGTSICFISYDIESEEYIDCMSLQFALYSFCGLFAD